MPETAPRPASPAAPVNPSDTVICAGEEFVLACGGCGSILRRFNDTPLVYRCFRCKRSVVRQDVPAALSGAEALSPEGRAEREGGALDRAGAER